MQVIGEICSSRDAGVGLDSQMTLAKQTQSGTKQKQHKDVAGMNAFSLLSNIPFLV